MIKHILKIIRNELRINRLLILEYFIIFCILWFVGEFTYNHVKQLTEPRGMNLEHTYRILMERADTPDGKPIEYSKEDHYRFATTLEERLKRYPGVESVGFSNSAAPITANLRSAKYRDETDSLEFYLLEGDVNLGYFEVFKIPVTGNMSEWDKAMGGRNITVVTTSAEGKIGRRQASDVRTIVKRDKENEAKNNFEVVGYAPPIKINFYEFFSGKRECRFCPLAHRDVVLNSSEIFIRIRPEADVNFIERFTRDMSEQLKIGEYCLNEVISYKEIAARKMTGLTEQVNTRFAVAGFLFANIFLGILGSFWFRTQLRRSEIGLRLAVGSSKVKVKWMMVTEAMTLLTLASVAATVACYFLQRTMLPLTIANVMPRANIVGNGNQVYEKYSMHIGIVAQDFINFGIAFGLLALITFIAVWYPAKQAADTQPAETLHED